MTADNSTTEYHAGPSLAIYPSLRNRWSDKHNICKCIGHRQNGEQADINY